MIQMHQRDSQQKKLHYKHTVWVTSERKSMIYHFIDRVWKRKTRPLKLDSYVRGEMLIP